MVGIGAVIGHEISHGFDDQGSKSDAQGNLISWWTPDDRTKFEARANCVVEQFNGYEVQPGLNVNGKLTLGENIGDLGGLNIAYTALMNDLGGKEPEKIDGFTAAQRFFLGWAQVWAAKSTPEAERLQVLGDPHSAADGASTVRSPTCLNLRRRLDVRWASGWCARTRVRSGRSPHKPIARVKALAFFAPTQSPRLFSPG
jgi:predicted metalloendopeptidase